VAVQNVSETEKLSFKYKFYWGIAALGTSLISGIYGGLLTIFYQDYLGLSARWIGIAATVYALWNAFNDPLFGYITDNTRSKRGRRIPYMRFTAPFLALTFILVWFAPPQAGQQTLFWWMLGSMLLYDTCYTIIGLVYASLLPEVTESDAQRNGLQISSSLFSMLGTLLGFMIPDFVRPKTGEASLVPLYIAMIAVGIIGMIFILITTFKIKERREFAVVDKPVPPLEAIKFTFTSKAFLVLVAENFMAILMSSLILGSIYYLADMLLLLPTGLLLLEGFIVVILLATGYEVKESFLYFLLLLAAFLIFQIGRQISRRLRVQKSIGKVEDGKALEDTGHPFEAIKLWKELLLSLPRDKYLEVLDMLEATYENQNLAAGVQQIKAIRNESLNFFEMTKNPQRTTANDRKEWQTQALKLRKMVKALPTEPAQNLSDAMSED